MLNATVIVRSRVTPPLSLKTIIEGKDLIQRLQSKSNSKGYLLLEVLIAIFILSVVSVSAIQIFSRSMHVRQRNDEFSEGRKAADNLLFKMASGSYPNLFMNAGGKEEGVLPAGDSKNQELSFEISSYRLTMPTAQPLAENKENFFKIVVKISKPEKSIYQTSAVMSAPL